MRVLRLGVSVGQAVGVGAAKRMPACEGIETHPSRGPRRMNPSSAKRMPACEGIETVAELLTQPTVPAKRMPACEGIETISGQNLPPRCVAVRQEDARL